MGWRCWRQSRARRTGVGRRRDTYDFLASFKVGNYEKRIATRGTAPRVCFMHEDFGVGDRSELISY